MGNLQEALADYNQAVHLAPNYVAAYFKRGIVYHRLGNFAKALEDNNQVLRLDPSCINAYYNRAIAYTHFGNLQEAIVDFDRVLRLNPNDAEADYTRKTIQLAEYCTHTIRHNPNNAEAYYKRATVYANLKNYIDADYDRGTVHVESGMLPEAIVDFTKVIEINPNYELAYLKRGTAYVKLNKFQEGF